MSNPRPNMKNPNNTYELSYGFTLGFRVFFVGIFSLLLFTGEALAAYPELTLRHNHHLFFLGPDEFPEWQLNKEIWIFEGKLIKPLPQFRVDGDEIPPLPLGVTRDIITSWDRGAIRSTLQERVASKLDREPGSVVIHQNTPNQNRTAKSNSHTPTTRIRIKAMMNNTTAHKTS